jgi:hypothetical protein
MKRTMIVLLMFGSVTSQAGIICRVKTLKAGKLVSELVLKEAHGYMGAGHLLDINVEKDTWNEDVRVSLAGNTSGWHGSESLAAVIYRHEFKMNEYNRSTDLTAMTKVEPNQEVVLIFEDYVTTISCMADDSF